MDATNFIAESNASAEAFKTANLLKLLSVNAIIVGELGTGKQTLAHYILPEAPIYNASDFDALLGALERHKAIIVNHLERAPNLDTLRRQARQFGTRIIATSSPTFSHEQLDEMFSVRVFLPPLSERPEDVFALQTKYVAEVAHIFGEGPKFHMELPVPDTKENANSLRKQIFFNYLLSNISEEQLMQMTEEYLADKIDSNNGYREFLHLYEVPLIRAGLARHKSQLQLADKLGLNRNTLRKKIADHKEFLDE